MRLVKIALITVAICIGVSILIIGVPYVFRRPKTAVTSFIKYVLSPQYQELSEFNLGDVGYECPKLLKAKKSFQEVGHMGGSDYEMLYVPVDQGEFNKICTLTWIE